MEVRVKSDRPVELTISVDQPKVDRRRWLFAGVLGLVVLVVAYGYASGDWTPAKRVVDATSTAAAGVIKDTFTPAAK